MIISLVFPRASFKVFPHFVFFNILPRLYFFGTFLQKMNYIPWICRNRIHENGFTQVTSMNKPLIYTLCLKFYCIRLHYFLVFRILAFKILYYSFVSRRMASNDESHINQTLHVQFKLVLRSIFIRAIRIIPSGENQVRQVFDHNKI